MEKEIQRFGKLEQIFLLEPKLRPPRWRIRQPAYFFERDGYDGAVFGKAHDGVNFPKFQICSIKK